MNKERLIRAIEKFKDKRIAVVGDIVIDKYVYGRVERVNPENPGAPLLKIEKKEFRLGCAANVALNISSLGAKALLACVTGDDFHGNLFEKLSAEKDFKLFNVKEGETIVKERSIESEFNQYLLRTDDGEAILEGISEESIKILYKFIESSEIDGLILSDYNKKIFRNGFGKKLIELANKKKIPVVIDPKPVNAESFKFATLLCPNIKEAKEIIGAKGENEKEVIKKLFEISKSRYLIVTCGKRGMVCYDGKEFAEIPTKAREVVDVTGAGDTACAAMALGIISDLNLIETAYLANYAAGIVIEKLGTSIVEKEELIERIKEDGDF